ncbi:MAG: hypothetical protein ACPGYT_08565 [Nitrospirales bacterium]
MRIVELGLLKRLRPVGIPQVGCTRVVFRSELAEPRVAAYQRSAWLSMLFLSLPHILSSQARQKRYASSGYR